jgi:hypothetical protein
MRLARQLACWLLLIGWLLAAAGASLAPWVERAPAALVLTAPDLAEFVKFLPEVRSGTLAVQRLLFLLPLWTVALGTPVVVTSARLAYPRWVRIPVLAAVVPLSLTLLPPVWSPTVLMSAEFRLQTVGCIVCLGLLIVAHWLRHLPLVPLTISLICLWLAAPVVALRQFQHVQASIASAYASAVSPGWGAWATAVGCALMCLGLAVAGYLSNQEHR